MRKEERSSRSLLEPGAPTLFGRSGLGDADGKSSLGDTFFAPYFNAFYLSALMLALAPPPGPMSSLWGADHLAISWNTPQKRAGGGGGG